MKLSQVFGQIKKPFIGEERKCDFNIEV